MSRISRIAAILVLALLAQGALGQATLYKSILKDGRVVYGEKPAPDAVKVEAIKTDTSKQGIVPPTAKESTAAQQLNDAQERKAAAGERVRALEEKVKQAEAALAAGKEPEPGERSGTAGGGSRLNDSYWERQKALEQAVGQAKAELANARAGR